MDLEIDPQNHIYSIKVHYPVYMDKYILFWSEGVLSGVVGVGCKNPPTEIYFFFYLN